MKEEKQPNIIVTWPTKTGIRKTTLHLPNNLADVFKAPTKDSINLKFYDRSNSEYQRQVYLNGKYIGTTIAPTEEHEKQIYKVVYILLGLGYKHDNLKEVFKSIFRATD